ncbi:hypothetical protein RclHR1_10220013 [Rhizophagus clarus]|uniref:Uncharacterized protein n=1 Tax=Rhizophagus clarus TaxID=94130 RepID=A0A2Z6QCW2_9GLOM|nr:hypothetical protein RclHR1_10220013 [Rhizophagus clarus]
MNTAFLPSSTRSEAFSILIALLAANSYKIYTKLHSLFSPIDLLIWSKNPIAAKIFNRFIVSSSLNHYQSSVILCITLIILIVLKFPYYLYQHWMYNKGIFASNMISCPIANIFRTSPSFTFMCCLPNRFNFYFAAIQRYSYRNFSQK